MFFKKHKQELLPTDCAFLVGAGISFDSGLYCDWYQSWILDAVEAFSDLHEYQTLEKIKEVLYSTHLKHMQINDYTTKLRFEAVVEILSKLEVSKTGAPLRFDCIKEVITAGTNKSEYPEIEPCYYHYALAELLKSGAVVLTTNFDCLIEKACYYLEYDVDPVITQNDFESIAKSENLDGKFFKIHGSYLKINHIKGNEVDTSNTIVSTLEALGQFAHLSLPEYKRIILKKILETRDLFVIGYSGFDLLDVVQDLQKLSFTSKKHIYWFDYGKNGHKAKPNYYVVDKTLSSFNPKGNKRRLYYFKTTKPLEKVVEDKILKMEISLKDKDTKYPGISREDSPGGINFRKRRTYFESQYHALTFLGILLHWCGRYELASECWKIYHHDSMHTAINDSVLDSVNNAGRFIFFHGARDGRFPEDYRIESLNQIIKKEQNPQLKELMKAALKDDFYPQELIWVPFLPNTEILNNKLIFEGLQITNHATKLFSKIAERIDKLGLCEQLKFLSELYDIPSGINQVIDLFKQAIKLHEKHGYIRYYYDAAGMLAAAYRLAGQKRISEEWLENAINSCEWLGEFGSIPFIEREYAMASFRNSIFEGAKESYDLPMMLLNPLKKIGNCVRKFAQAKRTEAVESTMARTIVLCQMAKLLITFSRKEFWDEMWRKEMNNWIS